VQDNDITVIDQDPVVLQELNDRLDLQTLVGNATHPNVLIKAGIDDADMLIAVTNSDEANMVACQIAYTLFHTPTKIARVRAVEYLHYPELFAQEALPIDVLISPERLVTEYIQRLIEHPGSLQVLDFAGGRVRLVGVRAYFGGPLVGNAISAIHDHLPDLDVRIASIFRRGKPIHPHPDTIIEADDELFFIAARKNIQEIIKELRPADRQVKKIMIAGGGSIGYRLASLLEKKYRVKLIERSHDRVTFLAENLDSTIIIEGEAADDAKLQEEGIDDCDLFISVTNDDEANILSAMLAKRMGARRVMALINRPAYVDLIEGSSEIDIAISPHQATIGSLLAHVRQGDVVMVHSLRRGAAEAIEAVAHGDPASSKVVGRTIGEIKLPKDTTIGAVVRGEQVLMSGPELVIQPEDHVVLFLVDKRRIPEVEKLFQVGLTFL
jgi:trk system potassium uptake protein TrkA